MMCALRGFGPRRPMRAALAFAGCALVFPLAASAAPAPADLPADARNAVLARAEAFVAAVNDSTPATRRTAVLGFTARRTLEELPEEKILALYQRLHDTYAPLELHHGELSGRVLHVFARTREKNRWHDFQWFFEPDAPYALSQLAFVADVAEPVYLPNGSLEDPGTRAWLGDYIDKLIREEDLSGAVLLARGDEILYQRSFGFEDSARAKAVTPETRFNLGSGNKMFTALAVMALVGEGRLSLDQTLAEFFPDFPDPDLAKKITVRHLLAHSSGLGDYWTKEYERKGWTATRIDEVVPFVYAEFRADGAYFAPGTDHRYSNSGYLLLGRIVEKVSGRDYYDFIRERIYEPLGMTRTDHYVRNGRVPHLASPLTRITEADSASNHATGAPRWANAPHGLRGTSAGGGYSTCADVLRFARALVAGRIVDTPTLDLMTSPQPPIDPTGAEVYGLGFLLETRRGRVRSFGHGGIARGVNFELRYFPDEDMTLVAFSNQDNGAYDDLRKNLTKLITGDR